jgi:hypothetical protein
MLLRGRVRAKLDPMPPGTYAVNPTPAPVSGWAGEGQQRFWVEKLAARSVAVKTDVSASSDKPGVRTDSDGWPAAATWEGMTKPLFEGALGDFIRTAVVPPADRRTITGLHAKFDTAKRAAAFRESRAVYKTASSSETPHTILFTQEFGHARLASGSRIAEFWKREPRVRITVRFDRISSLAPEVLHLEFALAAGLPLPELSCGGVPFTPYRDQLKGSCKDYYAIDGWAHYRTGGGHWLWVTRDAPLVAIGRPHVVELHEVEPEACHKILAIVFDNCWHTNFVADSHGSFEFQFDLVWSAEMPAPANLAEALSVDPIARVNPGFHESGDELKHIYRP